VLLLIEKLKEKYKRKQPYIITIMLTIVVTSFVMRGASDSTFVENFNFASTITSIILSVIAILITIIDRETSTSILNKTVEATETIDISTRNLNTASSKIDNFVNRLKSLEENIINTKEQSAATREAVITLEQTMKGSANMAHFKRNDIPDLNDVENLNIILSGLSFSTRQYILLIHQSFVLEKSINLLEFNDFIKKVFYTDDLPTYETIESISTTLDILRGLNLIEFEYDNVNLKVIYLNENFKKSIETVIPNVNWLADAPDGRFFGSVYEYLGVEYED